MTSSDDKRLVSKNDPNIGDENPDVRSDTLSTTADDPQSPIEKFEPYVTAIAKKIQEKMAQGVELETLIDFGQTGLVDAVDAYDGNYDARFMEFAYYRIRGAIIRGLRNEGLAEVDTAQADFEEKANELLGEYMRRDKLGDTSAGGEATQNPFEGSVQSLADAVQGLATAYMASQDGATSSGTSDVGGLLEARKLLRESFKELNSQERKLVKLYYYRHLSLETIADALGVSVGRTRYLHARVTDKLTQKMSTLLKRSEM